MEKIEHIRELIQAGASFFAILSVTGLSFGGAEYDIAALSSRYPDYALVKKKKARSAIRSA